MWRMKEELLQGGSTIYLVDMIHREKHLQIEPTTRFFLNLMEI